MKQQLYSISDDYDFLDTTMSIALVPVKDFDISEKYITDGNIFIYPKHSLDTSIIQGCKFDFTFEELKDTFYDATIIAFPIFFSQRLILGSLFPTVKDELTQRPPAEAGGLMWPKGHG